MIKKRIKNRCILRDSSNEIIINVIKKKKIIYMDCKSDNNCYYSNN